VGDLRLARTDTAGALRDFEEALALMERVVARFGALPQWEHDIARCRARIAAVSTPPPSLSR